MNECQRKFLTNDEQMYSNDVHFSHMDVSGNARTAVANAQWRVFAQTHLLLFGPTFVKCIQLKRFFSVFSMCECFDSTCVEGGMIEDYYYNYKS